MTPALHIQWHKPVLIKAHICISPGKVAKKLSKEEVQSFSKSFQTDAQKSRM